MSASQRQVPACLSQLSPSHCSQTPCVLGEPVSRECRAAFALCLLCRVDIQHVLEADCVPEHGGLQKWPRILPPPDSHLLAMLLWEPSHSYATLGHEIASTNVTSTNACKWKLEELVH